MRSFGSARPTMPLPDIGGDRGAAGLQVVAQPSSPVGAPRVADQGSDLAQALASLNPGITKYLANQDDANAKEQFELGARARLMQEGDSPIAMTPEQNPYWQQGYMKQHGVLAGQQAVQDMKTDYEQQHTQPGFDPQQFFAKHAQANLSGLTDKDALSTMMPQLDRAKGELMAQWGQYNLDQIRQQQDQNLNAGARGLVDNILQENDPLLQRSMYEQFRQQQRDDNHFTGPEAAQAVVREMLLRADKIKPEQWDWLTQQDGAGVSVADVKSGSPYGGTLAAAIDKGRDASVAAVNAQIDAAQKAANIQTGIQLEYALKTDPLSVGDPVKFVQNHLEMVKQPGQAEAMLGKIMDAQQKETEKQGVMRLIATFGGAGLPRAILEGEAGQMAKKEYQKTYDAMWTNTDMSNPDAVKSLLTNLIQYHQATGFLDQHLEGILKNAGTIGPAMRDDNVTQMTPEMRIALGAYQTIMQSNNPALIQTMPEDARAVMGNMLFLTEHGYTEGQAFNTAKRMSKIASDPTQRAAFESQWNKATEEGLMQRASSDFTKFGSSVQNAPEMAAEVLRLAKVKTAMLGLNPKDAVEQATKEVQATSVFDGQGRWVHVPSDVPKDLAQQYIQQYAKDGVAELNRRGQNGQPYVLVATGSGDNLTYHFRDAGLTEVLPSATMDDMKGRFNAANFQTPETVAATQQLKQQIASGGLNPSAVQAGQPGQLSPKDVQQNWQSYQERFVKGQINAREYERLQAMKKAQDEQDVRDGTSQLSVGKRAIPMPWEGDPELLAPKNDLKLGAQTPQPGGFNLDTKQYTLDALNANKLDFALTSAGEGLRLQTYKDAAGKRTIGLGYNIDARSPDQVQREFAQAGITGDRVQAVVDGKESITPREAMRLYDIVKPQYVDIAKSHFGEQAWDGFPDNIKAALTDIAYHGGNKLFGPIVDQMKTGDYAGAASNLKDYYHTPDGKVVENTRRISLWRGMFAGVNTFQAMIQHGV